MRSPGQPIGKQGARELYGALRGREAVSRHPLQTLQRLFVPNPSKPLGGPSHDLGFGILERGKQRIAALRAGLIGQCDGRGPAGARFAGPRSKQTDQAPGQRRRRPAAYLIDRFGSEEPLRSAFQDLDQFLLGSAGQRAVDISGNRHCALRLQKLQQPS